MNLRDRLNPDRRSLARVVVLIPFELTRQELDNITPLRQFDRFQIALLCDSSGSYVGQALLAEKEEDRRARCAWIITGQNYALKLWRNRVIDTSGDLIPLYQIHEDPGTSGCWDTFELARRIDHVAKEALGNADLAEEIAL